MPESSGVGNLASLKEGEILLPAYLLRQEGGIFVDLARFPVGGGFVQFIDRVFGNGMRFLNLDYRLMVALLYDYDAVLDEAGIDARLKLASGIVPFPAERKALYKGVKTDAAFQRAEYFFETVTIDVVTEEPVYGEPGPDGEAPLLGMKQKTETQPTRLDLDEFIADMWLKGVRFGIDVETVARVIARGETGRLQVAAQLDAQPGSDAEIEEATSVLHRDNSPKIMLNGKADLRKFQNRFPQIERGLPLLRKKPRVLGKHGYKVNGAVIEPEIPKDLDITPLAGPGTHIERIDGVEHIVSDREGFLSLDTASNLVSITEKIENKGGVSIKTTGDISLAGAFIEHGEVQEGRSVEGKDMTFHDSVYGNLLSHGGVIRLESNLSNASAISKGGDVTLNGRAFNSVIEAWEGTVSAKYVESCIVMAETVEIERAVNCEIIADKIWIEQSEGCAVAGKDIHIRHSTECRGKQTVVSVLLPDIAKLDAMLRQLYQALADCQKVIEEKERENAKIRTNPEVAKYLTLQVNIRQGVVKLTEAHLDNWKRMQERFAKVERALAALDADKQVQLEKIKALRDENAHLLEMRGKRSSGICCKLDEVSGDTLVRGIFAQDGLAEFQKISHVEIRNRLRDAAFQKERIFSGSGGELDWHYELPEIEGAPDIDTFKLSPG